MTDPARRTPRGPTRWIAVGVLIIGALNLGLYALESIYGSPSGAASSAFGTVPRGVAAYALLLQTTGHEVAALRTPLAEARIGSESTLVVLEPESIGARDIDAMRRFVERGGRLVAGGAGSDDWLDEFLDDPPEWSPVGVGDIRLDVPLEELGNISHVVAGGRGSWSDPGAADSLIGRGDENLLVVARIGDGQAFLLADVSPLQNRSIDAADNAALGLGLAGEQENPVYFAESVHGYSDATGIGAVPSRWRWALGCLTVAALVWLFARSRRLGPPQPPGKPLAPRRAAYVHALATTLARARHSVEAVRPVREAARRQLIRRAGLPKDAHDDDLRRASVAFGLNEEEIGAILDKDKDSDPLVVGRALARLNNKMAIGGSL